MPDLLPDFVPSWLSILSATQPFALSGLGLVIAGQLYLLYRKVHSMKLIDELRALVADLKELDFPKFVDDLKADAAGAEAAIEAELQTLVDELGTVVTAVKARLAPPAEPQPEQPAP